MLDRAGSPHQASAEQESDPRLQVREVRHGHEQFAAGRQHPEHLVERAPLVRVREVLEHVQAQHALVSIIRRGQGQDRRAPHVRGRVVVVHALDGEPGRVFLDEHPLAASCIEHTSRQRQRVEVGADPRELRDVGRVVVPGGIRNTVIVAADRVLAVPHVPGVGCRHGISRRSAPSAASAAGTTRG